MVLVKNLSCTVLKCDFSSEDILTPVCQQIGKIELGRRRGRDSVCLLTTKITPDKFLLQSDSLCSRISLRGENAELQALAIRQGQVLLQEARTNPSPWRVVAMSSEADGQTVGKTLRALRSKNRAPKKWLGQHYMVNQGITERTVQAANIQPGDLVLEVGPGTGELTQALLDAGAHVIGVEKDPDMASLAAERFEGSSKVQIIHEDFLKWPILPTLTRALELRRSAAPDKQKGLPLRAKVVANLPFNITTEVVRKFLPLGDTFSLVVLMLQDEAALRLVDPSPGSSEYRRISLSVQFFSDARYHFFIDRKNFLPPPNVNAAVVSFALRQPHNYPAVSSQKAFFSMINSAFNGKRKMLRNSLQHLYTPLQISDALTSLALPVTSRPEELTLEQFLGLFNTLDSEYGPSSLTKAASSGKDSQQKSLIEPAPS